MYLCNLSEINARLVNVKKDMDTVDFEDRREYIRFHSIFGVDYFRKHSSIFNEYYIIHEMLKTLITKEFPVIYKRQIAKTDIRNIYDYIYQHPKVSGYVFNRHFKNIINKYDESSFDRFCDFFLLRVHYNFMVEALKLSDNKRIFEKMFFPNARQM